MKSISFTHFKEKLLDGSKRRTFRCIFVPTCHVKEVVNIDWKEDEKRETLFQAKIKDIYPRQIENVDEEEAKLDGFKNLYEFKRKIMEINRIKDPFRWGFFILFERIEE